MRIERLSIPREHRAARLHLKYRNCGSPSGRVARTRKHAPFLAIDSGFLRVRARARARDRAGRNTTRPFCSRKIVLYGSAHCRGHLVVTADPRKHRVRNLLFSISDPGAELIWIPRATPARRAIPAIFRARSMRAANGTNPEFYPDKSPRKTRIPGC